MEMRNRMKKMKRILALIGVVLLLSLYVVSFVAALTANPHSRDFFMLSVIATIAIPIIIYAYMVLYRIFTKLKDEQPKETGRKDKGFEEAFKDRKS